MEMLSKRREFKSPTKLLMPLVWGRSNQERDIYIYIYIDYMFCQVVNPRREKGDYLFPTFVPVGDS